MQTLDDLYLKEERELKIYYSTLLLAELLKINFEYSNKEYNDICGDDVFLKLPLLKLSILKKKKI